MMHPEDFALLVLLRSVSVLRREEDAAGMYGHGFRGSA
jgi:hypothetical protein